MGNEKLVLRNLGYITDDFTTEDEVVLFSIDDESLTDVYINYLENESVVESYSIEEETCFSSPGYDCGVISIAFLTYDKTLGHFVVLWER